MKPSVPGRLYGTSRTLPSRWRALAVITVSGLALSSAASLAGGLVSHGTPPAPADQSRPLSATEADRLAAAPPRNLRDGRAGVRGTLGYPGAQVRVAGWIDWQRPIAYLSVTGSAPGPGDGLVQALPGVLALRPGRFEQGPPAEPPRDGWRIRPLVPARPDGIPLDSTLAVLFALAGERPDAGPLAAGARWLGADTVDGVPVDVLLGPGGTGAAWRYWLDADARLHRLETVVGTNVPLRLDFDRADRREVVGVAALGGRAVHPRPVTTGEADLLARLRQRNRATGGGTVSVTLPGDHANLVTAAGWLDWGGPGAYLAVRDSAVPGGQTLIRADRYGVAVRSNAEHTRDGMPPLAPGPGAWQWTPWPQRGTDDFDVLLRHVLALSGWAWDDPAVLRRTARWLRADRLDGEPVTVYEIPPPVGATGLRYWVDASGRLRRLEVRTRAGAYGQLDVRIGARVPALPAVALRG